MARKYINESPFKAIKESYLSDGNEKFYVGDYVLVNLKNGETTEGKLINATSKSITLQESNYEYTERGIEYKCNFVMLNNVNSMQNTGCIVDEIDWEEYKKAINNDESRY